jgi:anti-sigma regulatory factor (Ser/Thr protein kinase)
MEVCCAGQFAPWRWLNDQWQPTETHHGLPLGIFSGFTYHAHIFPCQPGEKWLLFSDGINEGRNAAGEDYGNERLKNSLTAGSPRRVLDRAWAAWSQFAATQDLHDDACLTIFGCRPGRKLSILSRPQQCKVVRSFIESWTFYAGFNDIERGQIQLAVDEAVTNIMRHTYCQESDEVIEIGVEFDDQNLTFRLRDFGPTLKPEQLKKKDLADVRPGGLGLHLLEMTFQTVRFEPHDPGNELILIKALP